MDTFPEKVLGLSKEFYKWYAPTYDGAGRLLTVKVRTYDDAAQMVADTPPGSQPEFRLELLQTNVYDAEGRLDDVQFVKVAEGS